MYNEGGWLEICATHMFCLRTVSLERLVIGESNKQDIMQASTLTQNGTGPVGPVKPKIYWSCKNVAGPTNFSLQT